MSQENVDLVRSLYAAWARGDYTSWDWADPEIEFVAADGPATGRWTGKSGLLAGARGFLAAWEDYRIEPAEYRELDPERVLVVHNVRGRGKSSGVDLGEMGLKAANLFYLRDGKVTRLVAYFSFERALEAVGLSE
jgi:ketosteroid isomerase-like protein